MSEVAIAHGRVVRPLGELVARHCLHQQQMRGLRVVPSNRLDTQIAALQRLRDGLDSCIGCGCLSLKRCAISNPLDVAAASDDAPGAVYLPATLRRPHRLG